MNYRDTLNLPKTDFPMRANLPGREPNFVQLWEKAHIYNKIRSARKGSKLFVLHDGPPYANGNIHMGHALNKVLKDIIVKMKSMQGYDSPYIPGWDCHGLPIEHEVMKKLGKDAKTKTQDEIRKLCREYADKFIEIQKIDFKRLGVFGDFDDPYLTMSHSFEAGIVKVFGDLFKKGYIYKGLKPIHWCGNCNTALAEAEIEYDDKHVSPSIYVKFPIKGKKDEYVLIWTTTPWTLPANVAVAFNPDLEYIYVKNGNEKYVVAKELLNSINKAVKLEMTPDKNIEISEIEKLELSHPFITDRQIKPVFGDHVTLEAGTGCVHTAPGHGQEDYMMGLKYNLPILSPVNANAVFTKEAGEWEGLHVFTANEKIIEKMQENNALLFVSKVTHSYPKCWRCKKDVIFRATPQWFLSMEKNGIKDKAIEAIKNVKWVPNWGELRMHNMLENRPDWCLSRQRAWGVPIPAFTCSDCGETYMTAESVDLFADIVSKEGVDIWFTSDTKELLPKNAKCSCGSTRFEKESDILDVWFDSGVSHFCVVDERKLGDQADVYLEGSDQYRGWFQSSLWPSIAIKNKPPYREVITHGFMLDEQGRAMSKSAGNGIPPMDIINKYGADILRLWVVSENYQDNIKLGHNLLNQVAEAYKKIRFTLRFLLSNLYDYDNEKNRVPYKDFDELAKWAAGRLSTVSKEAIEHYNAYSFHNVFNKIHLYCVVDLSNFYLDIIKDIMYSDGADSKRRRMHQTVLYDILVGLTHLLAPVLTFTCEEVYQMFFDKDGSVHTGVFAEFPEYTADKARNTAFETIFKMKEDVYQAIEAAKTQNIVGNNLEAKVTVTIDNPDILAILKAYQDNVKDYIIVSGFKTTDKAGDDFYKGVNGYLIKVEKADGEKCERCWVYYPSVGSHSDHPTLCDRCYEVVTKL